MLKTLLKRSLHLIYIKEEKFEFIHLFYYLKISWKWKARAFISRLKASSSLFYFLMSPQNSFSFGFFLLK